VLPIGRGTMDVCAMACETCGCACSAEATTVSLLEVGAAGAAAVSAVAGAALVSADVPLDVVQALLGHASLQTTSVYVTAEEKRRRAEIAKYHARLVQS